MYNILIIILYLFNIVYSFFDGTSESVAGYKINIECNYIDLRKSQTTSWNCCAVYNMTSYTLIVKEFNSYLYNKGMYKLYMLYIPT